MNNDTKIEATKRFSTRNKVIASTLAGLALVGTIAVGGGAVAGAATTATSAVSQTVAPQGGHSWLKAHRKEIRAAGGKTVATTIGISTDELKQDLKNGQSIAEIATAHNVDPQTVATALVNQIDARIDKAVTDGKLTQAQADKAKAKVPTIAGKLVNAHRGDHKKAAGN